MDSGRVMRPSALVEDEGGRLRARRGLSEEVVRELSRVKGEPQWMADLRLRSLAIFERTPWPKWGVDLSPIADLDDLVLYAPPVTGRYSSWDEVPQEMKDTYERLGVPQAEREVFAGVVGVWDQEPVYERLKEEYASQGIIFCSMDSAVRDYPDLVRPYFMTRCIPPQDNKLTALHGAVWSGGAMLYVPAGVKVDRPLQSYFRMQEGAEGSFEHTLIVVEEGADANYIEACSAMVNDVNSIHGAAVEIFVAEGAKARYTSSQSWSHDVWNLPNKRARVMAEGRVEWVAGSLGAKRVMLYPSSFLLGEGASAEHLAVGTAIGDVHKDTGAKVFHLAPRTTSSILAKSISGGGGRMGYRGLVRMGPNAHGSKTHVQCDGLLLDDQSHSDTWPDIQIACADCSCAHEASVGRISDDMLFYCGSRGIPEDEAATAIVNGFIEPVSKEMPLEYSVELNRMIRMDMEGSVG
jgi:Fe-S cluster assembly protein SufB